MHYSRLKHCMYIAWNVNFDIRSRKKVRLHIHYHKKLCDKQTWILPLGTEKFPQNTKLDREVTQMHVLLDRLCIFSFFLYVLVISWGINLNNLHVRV